jgi:peroxiredoxin
VTIRLRFRDFAGRAVLHCHTLDHEDQGMMQAIEIVDPRNGVLLSAEPEQRLAEVTIPAPSSSMFKSQELRDSFASLQSRDIVIVFFRGMKCFHCVRELRELLQCAARLDEKELTILAISSEPIERRDAALEALDVPSGVAFQLVVDPEREAFRSFGSYAERPLHGLFIVDRAGLIRAKYVGATPFADVDEVCQRLRQLAAGRTIPDSE